MKNIILRNIKMTKIKIKIFCKKWKQCITNLISSATYEVYFIHCKAGHCDRLHTMRWI